MKFLILCLFISTISSCQIKKSCFKEYFYDSFKFVCEFYEWADLDANKCDFTNIKSYYNTSDSSVIEIRLKPSNRFVLTSYLYTELFKIKTTIQSVINNHSNFKTDFNFFLFVNNLKSIQLNVNSRPEYPEINRLNIEKSLIDFYIDDETHLIDTCDSKSIEDKILNGSLFNFFGETIVFTKNVIYKRPVCPFFLKMLSS